MVLSKVHGNQPLIQLGTCKQVTRLSLSLQCNLEAGFQSTKLGHAGCYEVMDNKLGMVVVYAHAGCYGEWLWFTLMLAVMDVMDNKLGMVVV